MQGRKRELGVALGLVIGLCLFVPASAGCRESRRTPLVPMIVPESPLPSKALFCPDEYLKWSLRWKGLEAASTEMITGQPGQLDGEAAIIVYSLSVSSELVAIFQEVREELSSQVSLASGLPLRNNSHATEDDENEVLEVEFSPSDSFYSVKLHGSVAPHWWKQSVAGTTSDLHTFLARLRVWDGTPEAGRFALVQNGRSHYRVDLIKTGAASLQTILGKIPTIRIQGRATRLFMDGKKVASPEQREFTLWRSDDDRFLPLRFEIDTRLGVVRGTLVDYRRPETRPCITVGGP